MKYHVEVLRFHRGEPRRGQAPEAMVQPAPPNAPSEAGDLLVVLVELSPAMPHRAREVRTLAAEVYWRSSGSIIARLRRALTEANRYLIHRNETAPPEGQAAGSITCALFRGEELFLGQVGAANAFLQSPGRPPELFPHQSRLFPLGASLPPVINVGYAELVPGSTLLLATGELAESRAQSLWAETLAAWQGDEQSLETIEATMAQAQASGTMIFVRCEAEPAQAEEEPHRRPGLFSRLRGAPVAPLPAAREEAPPPQPAPPPLQPGEPTAAEVEPPTEEAPPPSPPPVARTRGPRWHAPSFTLTWPGKLKAALRSGRRLSLPKPHLPPLRPLLHEMGDLLLPRTPQGSRRRRRPVPSEQSLVMGGLTLGFLLVIFFITLTTYLQEGGAQRASVLLQEAREAQTTAYAQQTEEAWEQVVELCDRILALDPQNEEAQALRKQAQTALDALNQAALLQIRPLLTLGSSRHVRHILVAKGWLYLLDPDPDTLIAYPLSADGLSLQGDAPLTVIQKGQAIFGEPVGELVDMAWLEPTAGYKGGAILIYGEGGVLYTYEPDLGPESCALTHLSGEPLPPASVTAMDTFGNALYLLQRQSNQILKYQPYNGLYDNPPRPYFAPSVAPPLAEALDMAIDGRIYLLMGDGSLQAYSEGVPDPSFEMETPPGDAFKPRVMTMERDPTEGRFYLVDPEQERIAVLDKHGHFLHQYRLEGEALRSTEAIAVGEEPYVLYLLMKDGLYAAPFPTFARPQEGP